MQGVEVREISRICVRENQSDLEIYGHFSSDFATLRVVNSSTTFILGAIYVY